MITKSITLKDEIINYSVIYKNKKNISIKINGNKEICVYAPIGISYDYIEELLKSKENWIIKNIKMIDTNNLNDGTYIIYRGRKFLKIVEESIIEEIVIKDDLIIIRSRNTDIHYVNDLISSWYLENVNNVILNRVNTLSSKYNLLPSKVLIRNQKSRWGSCNSRREIRLNWRLVLMPDYVMDYIIIHELCHLKHMNHSNSFWSLVYKLDPDFQKSKEWLKENGLSILQVN
ncbi:MAG: SprT family zinc-dependent metalloprotease [Clostridium sp.]|uniref:M48 family metallopeptidase n=1 Tax=Clostridium sp. TaxID=1506 RepID=UPI00290C2A9F|nr:SprT family zinc-dependent metalloprotease [Clostridium sp.]MDU5110378.1 SprT family zinc-dependent metalloprotease [Clostridium sp.]